MSTTLFIRNCNHIKLWIMKVPSSITIEDLKKEIEIKWHIPVITQCLSTKDTYDLPNNKQICEYNSNKISMHLTIKKL